MNEKVITHCSRYRLKKTVARNLIIMFGSLIVLLAMPTLVNNVAAVKLFSFILIIALFIFLPEKLFCENRLLFLVGMTFFPVTLTLGGRDTFSTATFAILLTASFVLIKFLLQGRARTEMVTWIGILIIIALTGVFQWDGINLSRQARHFLNFSSSAILFLILVNAPGLFECNRIVLARKLIIVMIWMVVAQLLIGTLVYYAPETGKAFQIFLTRITESLTTISNYDYTRIQSLVLSKEGIGEIVSILTPFIIILALEGKKKYWIAYGAMTVGLMLANTRAGIILFVIANIIMFSAYRFHIKRFAWLMLAIILGSGIVLLSIQSQIVIALIYRMDEVLMKISQHDNLIEILNRSSVWYDAWEVTISTLSLSGNGPAPSQVVGLNELNMHSLFMTIVYQFGIVGAVIYFSLFFYIFFRLIRRRSDVVGYDIRKFRFACVTAIFIFFLHEIKFEFNRSDSYQQIIWVFFAACYLISKTTPRDHHEYFTLSHDRVANIKNLKHSMVPEFYMRSRDNQN